MRKYLEAVMETIAGQTNGLYGYMSIIGEDAAVFAESQEEQEEVGKKITKIKEAIKSLDDAFDKLRVANNMEIQ
jgi:hypothetical protein